MGNQPLVTNYFQAPEIRTENSQTNDDSYVIDEERIEENPSEENLIKEKDSNQGSQIKRASFTKKWEKFSKQDRNSAKKRGWYRCTYICPYGKYKGLQCTFSARSDSSKLKGQHIHTYNESELGSKEPIKRSQLTDILVEFTAKSNISFRKACSPEVTKLLNDCIQYGHSIGRKKEILTNEDKFPHINRNQLRALTIQKSEEIKEEFVSKFKNSDVFLSIDGAKICNISSIDVSLIGYTSSGKFETFLYDTYEMDEHSTEKFKEIGLTILDELHKKKNNSKRNCY